jgi:hypothetical protein
MLLTALGALVCEVEYARYLSAHRRLEHFHELPP